MSLKRLAAGAPLVALAACATAPRVAVAPPAPAAPVEVQILGINDFHGNLEPPKNSIDATLPDGTTVKVPAGGVTHLASAAQALRRGHQHSVTVSAGDMIGASPLISSMFLDEPTVAAMGHVGVEYNTVGNHEFDRGSAELRRMQEGGCAKHTSRTPCAVEPFRGAPFKYLAANVLTESGSTFFPGSGIKDFGPVQVGIVGMTLKETSTLVTPAGVAGLTFADEAATANALVPQLKAAGADAIVLLIHQGARTSGAYNDKSCPGLTGDILPIIERLDPAFDAIVSGHTHNAYVCEVAKPGRTRPLLLTSAGRYGTLITDIRLTVDPLRGVTAHRADNVIVQGEGYGDVKTVAALPIFAPDAAADALVARYRQAAAPAAARVIGCLAAAAPDSPNDDESPAANLIADAQLDAGERHGAQLALMNGGGVRKGIVPAADCRVSYGDIFEAQPFGNGIVVMALTGAQLKAVLEQQFDEPAYAPDARPMLLVPSAGFAFEYDLSRPVGNRIVAMRLGGRAVDPAATYRVAINNFIASGGDGYSVFTEGRIVGDAGPDLDALEAWLMKAQQVPRLGRTINRTPR